MTARIGRQVARGGNTVLLEYIKMLFAHYRWANERILKSVEDVEPDRARDGVRPNYQRIHEALAHMIGAEALWRLRWQGQAAARPALGEATSLSDLRERWQDEG